MARRSKLKRYARREVFPARSAPIYARRVRLNGDLFAHDHDFMEAVVIVRGRGQHVSTQGEQPVEAGDAFLLRPGVWHGYRNCAGLEVFNCCFGVELLRRELAWLRNEPRLNYLLWTGPLALERHGLLRLRLAGGALQRCVRRLHALADVTAMADSERQLEAVALLLLFLQELARATGLSSRTPSPSPSSEAVLRAIHRLEADLAEEWTLEKLADPLQIHPTHLVRLFKAQTGLPPMAYLGRCRAERAASLLLRTAQPIGEVGMAVGWFDQNYFARRFRAYFGLSPSAYRRKCNNAARPSPGPGGVRNESVDA